MIKKIVGTTFSRIIITVSGLGILMMNTRYLGAVNLGKLSLILVALNLILQCSELVGGPSLVYLQKKYKLNNILGASYFWAIFISLSAYTVLHFFFENQSIILIISISAFVQSINHTHLHLLVGKERIKSYNVASVLQTIFLLILVIIFYHFQNQASILVYLQIYLAGQILLLILSWAYLSDLINKGGGFGFDERLVSDLYRYGFIIQMANIFQFGVYRINYIILEAVTSTGVLGVYSLGNQLSEKALIPGNAISMVQYSKISNSDNHEESINLTIKLLNLSLMMAIISATALILIPKSIVIYLFGSDFAESSSIFLYLAPGIIFMSISTIYSHYFAGLGKYYLNGIISFIGVVTIIVISLILIPIYGMKGAAIATSTIYFIQMIAQVFIFKNVSQKRWKYIFDIHKKMFLSMNMKNLINGIK